MPPPSREFTRQQMQTPPPGGSSDSRRGPRLFDPAPGDPVDPASFFATLGTESRALRDDDFLRARRERLVQTARRVIALAAIQTGCALLIVLLQALQPPSLRDSAMLLTALVVAVSGGLGLYGALKHTVWPLHAFFMTQIWVLAAVAAQWMRSQTAAARQAVFYSAQLHPAQSPLAKTALQSVAIFVSFGVVYASMFYTDLLAERMQDGREQEDERSLMNFAWLMHKKTLVGVQRFEDMIHAKFEELVLLGFLKPRWHPQHTR